MILLVNVYIFEKQYQLNLLFHLIPLLLLLVHFVAHLVVEYLFLIEIPLLLVFLLLFLLLNDFQLSFYLIQQDNHYKFDFEKFGYLDYFQLLFHYYFQDFQVEMFDQVLVNLKL